MSIKKAFVIRESPFDDAAWKAAHNTHHEQARKRVTELEEELRTAISQSGECVGCWLESETRGPFADHDRNCKEGWEPQNDDDDGSPGLPTDD